MKSELNNWGTKIKKLTQTRFKTEHQRGNCYPTAIACLMGLDNPEDVIQFQELYDDANESWFCVLMDWLEERGYEVIDLERHLFDGSIYMVSGRTVRESSHVCLYKNGKLWHDVHPSGDGLITEDFFTKLSVIKSNLEWKNEGFFPNK